MDGVILVSEPFWRQTQTVVLAKRIIIIITEEDCIQNNIGKRIDDAALTWCQLF